MAFKLRSPAFGPGGDIPVKHTCDGSHVSPPLRWTDPPDGTKSFALAVADLDSTSGVSVHWLLYGIPPTLRELHEDIPRQDAVPLRSRHARLPAAHEHQGRLAEGYSRANCREGRAGRSIQA